MVEIARGRPAADEEHHREGDRQQAQDVGHLEEQGPQGQRFSEGPDDRRQPLVRQVHRHQWSEQPAKELAEQPVEDPAGDPLGDRGQREDVLTSPRSTLRVTAIPDPIGRTSSVTTCAPTGESSGLA